MAEGLTDKQWLMEVADLLDSEGDFIEGPEGTRWIQMSEEFAQMLAARLRDIAEGWDGEWVRTVPQVEYDLGELSDDEVAREALFGVGARHVGESGG